MQKKLASFLGLLIITSFFSFALIPATGQAKLNDDIQNQLQPIETVYDGANTTDTSLAESVAKIIRAVLGFLGVIFIVLMVYAGFTWMTAGGGEEKIKKAKDTMVAATIGAAICLGAYAITYFVMSQLLNATTGGNLG